MASAKRILVLGTSQGGGDWPPLAAVTVGLHQAGHAVQCFGDPAIAQDCASMAIPVEVGPAADAVGTLMAQWRAAGASGPPPLRAWADACWPAVRALVSAFRPELVLSQFFTMELARLTKAACGLRMSLARSALQTLAAFPVRVVVTLSAGHPRDELGTVPANARLEQFVPHSAVLKRSGLLVSHAGHGVVAKALYYGVPMVLVPWGRDQPGVAFRAAALGIAEVLARHDLTEPRLSAAIHRVLDTPRYQAMAARIAGRLQAQDPVALARARIEALLEAT